MTVDAMADQGAKRWFAVHTHVRGEGRAFDNLCRQGFHAWLPLCKKKRRHAGRVETVNRPLFPRYLFVAIDLSAERWRAILSTFGVAGLVGTNDGPQPVPVGVVEALKARADPDGLFTLHGAGAFRTGDSVRVTAGPMRDIEGVLQAMSERDRVVILLNLMGRDLHVTVPAGDIDSV